MRYTGRPLLRGTVGAPSMITSGSEEEALIADYLEGGFGTRFTTLMVNTHRAEIGRTKVGCSAVMAAAKRMMPVVTKVQKRSQGSSAHEAWVTARFHQTLQMCVMLREYVDLKTIRGMLQLQPSDPLPLPSTPRPSPLSLIHKSSGSTRCTLSNSEDQLPRTEIKSDFRGRTGYSTDRGVMPPDCMLLPISIAVRLASALGLQRCNSRTGRSREGAAKCLITQTKKL